jgi:hypothetical protein
MLITYAAKNFSMEPRSSTMITNALHLTITRFLNSQPLVKGEGKMIRLHAMKAHEWNKGTAPLFLNPGTRRRPLYILKKRLRFVLSGSLDKLKSRSGPFEEVSSSVAQPIT